MITVAAEDVAPENAAALSVHPNPLRDTAKIRFGLERPEALTLEVFDVQGRRVRTVSLGALGVGAHALPFEQGDLSVGAYRIRLTGSGGFSTTRGFIIHR